MADDAGLDVAALSEDEAALLKIFKDLGSVECVARLTRQVDQCCWTEKWEMEMSLAVLRLG